MGINDIKFDWAAAATAARREIAKSGQRDPDGLPAELGSEGRQVSSKADKPPGSQPHCGDHEAVRPARLGWRHAVSAADHVRALCDSWERGRVTRSVLRQHQDALAVAFRSLYAAERRDSWQAPESPAPPERRALDNAFKQLAEVACAALLLESSRMGGDDRSIVHRAGLSSWRGLRACKLQVVDDLFASRTTS
ncbi:MAG: hypothetical protein ACRCT8_00650 [Lacipirellulaceae bacterium]